MRKWRSLEVSADDEWAVNHQIVVPKIYRSEILSLAHETPMSGSRQGIRNHIIFPFDVPDVKIIFL